MLKILFWVYDTLLSLCLKVLGILLPTLVSHQTFNEYTACEKPPQNESDTTFETKLLVTARVKLYIS